MSLEERLRDALWEQADHVDVDLPRLHALAEEKLAHGRRRPVRPLLAAAAAVAVVAAGLTYVARSGASAPSRPPVAVTGPHAPEAGAVDARFVCLDRSTTRFGAGTGNAFVPSLAHGARGAAAETGAPRFAFRVDGDTATLRLGNADGSLGSVSTFARGSDGRWRAVSATRCVNGPYLADNPRQILPRVPAPSSVAERARQAARGCGAPTFVDGHGYYDAAGLLRHEWTYAASCPTGAARLTVVTRAGATTATLAPRGLQPVGLSRLLPSGVGGQPGLVAVWALSDPHHRVAGLSVRLDGGRSVPADRVSLHGQGGTLFVVMAPRDQVRGLVVHPVHGAPVSYSSSNPPGYRQ